MKPDQVGAAGHEEEDGTGDDRFREGGFVHRDLR